MSIHVDTPPLSLMTSHTMAFSFFFSKSGETEKQNPGTLEKSNMADLVGKTAGDCGIVVGLIQ